MPVINEVLKRVADHEGVEVAGQYTRVYEKELLKATGGAVVAKHITLILAPHTPTWHVPTLKGLLDEVCPTDWGGWQCTEPFEHQFGARENHRLYPGSHTYREPLGSFVARLIVESEDPDLQKMHGKSFDVQAVQLFSVEMRPELQTKEQLIEVYVPIPPRND